MVTKERVAELAHERLITAWGRLERLSVGHDDFLEWLGKIKERADDSVLCVSDAIYQGVVRHGPLGVRPDRVGVQVDLREEPKCWTGRDEISDLKRELRGMQEALK